MKQYQIKSRPRHLRFLYFIDESYSFDNLLKLICSNFTYWGGTYNPIIPIKDNVIGEEYKIVLKFYDPDYIFYSSKVDPEILKRLRIFNPVGYFNIEEAANRITGVNSLYLISFKNENKKVLLSRNLWEIKSPLLDFYKLNFGLNSGSTVGDYEIVKNRKIVIIDPGNFNSINEILYNENPVSKSVLSKINLNTVVLRDLNRSGFESCELVIAKEKKSNPDLFYFSFRRLFEGNTVIYLSIEELDLLLPDPFFGKLLFALSRGTIDVVSKSLGYDDLQQIINLKLKPLASSIGFNNKLSLNPSDNRLDANGLFERNYGEYFTAQTIISEKGLLGIPPLSFTNKVEFYSQKWAVDIEMQIFGESYLSEIKFPLTTDTHNFLKNVSGRINRERTLSVILDSQFNTSSAFEMNIPDINSMIRQVIINPVIDGDHQNSRFGRIDFHDASQRLMAFLKAFTFNFLIIEEFLGDEFWFDLFKELATSKKVAGDTVTFDQLKEKIKKKLVEKQIVQVNKDGIIKGNKEETYLNEENLVLGVRETLSDLIRYRVFLKGFNLKCETCSSMFWYHLVEINDIYTCKGCSEKNPFPIEPQFSYKLNDLIKNNICQPSGDPDGNLTVIRTLAYLQQLCRYSFQFTPQINIYDKSNIHHPYTDLDIVCISDGQLIIGEAKHDSKSFSNENSKALKSLVTIAKEIRPDKIILSCSVDSHGKLEKAKSGLIHLFNRWEYMPIIETLYLDPPDDFNLEGIRYFYY